MPASPEAATPTSLGLDPALEGSGLNVAGVLEAGRYDARVPAPWRTSRLLPGARSAVLIGSGGPAFFRCFRSAAASRAPDTPLDTNPLDTFGRQVLEREAERLEASGFRSRPFFYYERIGGEFADFVALGRACGLGAPSRLGVLVHPGFGPWLALRSLLLTERPLPPTRGPAAPGYEPCTGCPAPCAEACHGGAVGIEAFDAAACGRTRQRSPGPCTQRCDARRACVIGREHAYDADAEAFYARAVLRALAAGAGAGPRPGE